MGTPVSSNSPFDHNPILWSFTLFHMMQAASATPLILYTYYRSSCSARLRIALAHKHLPYTPVFVNLSAGSHHDTTYHALNPSGTVPTLISPAHNDLKIGQSIAALEFLEEAFPATPSLLPPAEDVAGRATVRQLVAIIAADTQPLTSRTVFARVEALGGDASKWARDAAVHGLGVYEAAVSKTAGRYSVGDEVTMADVVLVPAVWNAAIWGVDLGAFRTVRRIYENLMELGAFRGAHWREQGDCPDEVREGGRMDVV